MRTIRAVVFDIGETLVDETEVLGRWADWLGVPRLTFFASLGARIARGQTGFAIFETFDPEFDLREQIERRLSAGEHYDVGPSDLYPDALSTLAELRELGFRVGVAGNQPASIEPLFRNLEPALDLVGISEAWGLHKPDPRFFERIAEELQLPPEQIAYCGDRFDNDVIPAVAAGMLDIHIRRGPFGFIQTSEAEATHTVDSLMEIPKLLAQLRSDTVG